MRAAIFLAIVAACGGASPGPAHAPAHAPAAAAAPAAPAANLVATVTAEAITAGDMQIVLPADDPYGVFTAMRDAFVHELHGAAHPAIVIAADAHGDAALLAIAALVAAGADRVDVRAQDQRRVCDVARPPARPLDQHPVDGAAPRAELSVLVTADAIWVGATGGELQRAQAKDVAAAVAKLGGAAAFHDRTDAELAVDRGVPASALLDVIGAMCGRFPALRIVAPDGLSMRPQM